MSWINFCRMNEAIEELTPTGSIRVIRRSWDSLPEKDLVASLLTLEYPQNNLGQSKAIKWLTAYYDVFDDEIETYASIYGDLGEGIYFFDESADDSEYSITQVYELLSADCSRMDGRPFTLFCTMFNNMSALEKKWFIRFWIRTLRHGFGRGNFVKLLALVYDRKQKDVKRHAMFNTYTDITSCYMANEEPSVILTHGNFIKPMLAKAAPKNKWPKEKIIEYKYDGARYQIHRKDNSIIIFNRKGVVVTHQFEDIVNIISQWDIKTFIIDTEIYPVLPNGRPAVFQKMNARFHSKNHDEAALKCPVSLAVFDAMMVEGVSLMDEPLSVRMGFIERFPNQALRMNDAENSIGFYNQAISDGYEGIMIKALDGKWESGKRSMKWIKYKPPRIELDVVITGGRYGDGKRSSVYGSYDMAVADSEGGFIPIGSIGTGFSDMDLINLTQQLKKLVTNYSNGQYTFSPRIVIQVTSDLVTKNETGQYGLRFPRMMRIRNDKPVNEIDSIDTLKGLM